jgi:hypothetical protein
MMEHGILIFDLTLLDIGICNTWIVSEMLAYAHHKGTPTSIMKHDLYLPSGQFEIASLVPLDSPEAAKNITMSSGFGRGIYTIDVSLDDQGKAVSIFVEFIDEDDPYGLGLSVDED